MGTLPSSVVLRNSSPHTQLPVDTDDPRIETTRHSRWWLRALILFTTASASLLAGVVLPASASAASGCGERGCVDVVAVDGIIDDIVADFISSSIERANDAGDVVQVVLQMDSPGTAVSDVRLGALAETISKSRVPVSVWIGASGARALGGSAELVFVADSAGIAPGAQIGAVGRERLNLVALGARKDLPVDLLDRIYSGEAAVKAGLVDQFNPTLVDHVGNLDTVESKSVTVNGKKQLQPLQRVRLSKLPLPVQIMHTAASPSVAYLLLVIGAALLLFEFFTAGVGVAGAVGAGFVLLGGYGLAELPHRGWALGLFVAAFVAFAIDMQTGLARLWTWLGFVAFTVSSIFLFSEFYPTIIATVVGIGGMAAVVFAGMPSMNRARFGTPYIGREWLEAETGEVTAVPSPVGLVRLRDTEWLARPVSGVEARQLAIGTRVVVRGADRLLVEIEPADDNGSGAHRS